MSGEQKGGLDLSSVVGMLSENPAILGNLMSAFSAPAPDGEMGEEKSDGASVDPELLSKLAPVLSMLGSGKLQGGEKSEARSPQNARCELLRALRPFLSPSRCEAIDYIIKMDGLSGMLRGLKL